MEEEFEQEDMLIGKCLTDDQLQHLSYLKHHKVIINAISVEKCVSKQKAQQLLIEELQQQNDSHQKEISELKTRIEELKLKQESNQSKIESLKQNALLHLKARSQDQQELTWRIQEIKNKKDEDADDQDEDEQEEQKNNFNKAMKKKRKQYTQKEKQDILKGFELFSATELEKISGVSANVLYKWKKVNGATKKRAGRKRISDQLENFLIEVITEKRLSREYITRNKLKELAEEYIKENNIQHELSIGYFTAFFKRNHYSIRRINSKKQYLADFNQIKDFYENFIEKINTNQYDKDHIINFDETGIQKTPLVNYTIASTYEKHVQIIANAKEQLYSVGLAISMSGKKLQQMLIWPSKGIKRIFQASVPKNIKLVYREKKSYFTQAHFKSWIQDILAVHAATKPVDKKGILLIDNFRGHKIGDLDDLLSEFGYEKLFLPSNSTDLLQPLDLQVNKTYKDQYKTLFEDSYVQNSKITHDSFLSLLSKVWENIDATNSWSIYQKEGYLKILEQKLSINKQDKEELDSSSEKQDESEIIDLDENSSNMSDSSNSSKESDTNSNNSQTTSNSITETNSEQESNNDNSNNNQ